jgi:hypothetical protein
LTSPASITPAGDGTAALAVVSTGAALSSINIGDGNNAGQSSSIDMVNGSGGNSKITLAYVDLVQAGFSGVLTVANNSTSLGVLSVDTAQNIIGLGSSAGAGSISVNTPLTYATTAGAPKAAFPATVLNSTSGSFVAGANSVALGGLGAGLYAMYGDSGASTAQNDLDCRFNSIVQINPAGVCSGGAGGSDTGWNLSPNGTGGLTLELTNAPTSAFSVKAYPIYMF